MTVVLNVLVITFAEGKWWFIVVTIGARKKRKGRGVSEWKCRDSLSYRLMLAS